MNNMKRMRGRNHRPGGGGGGGGGGGPVRHQSGNIPPNRNYVFDSSGPDLRVRGTSQQLFEKYLQLGRDATSVGDRVMAEGYFQHAEHYFRILNAQAAQMNQAMQQQQGGQGQNGQGQHGQGQNGQGQNGQSQHGQPNGSQSNGHQSNQQRRYQGEPAEPSEAGEPGFGDQGGRDEATVAGPGEG